MWDILIVCGTSGVGKSTVSRNWAEGRKGATIECDCLRDWIRDPVRRLEHGFQEALLARQAAALAEGYLDLGLHVAIDNFWRPAGLELLRERLQHKGRMRIFWLQCAVDENHRRDRQRPRVLGKRLDRLRQELESLDWPKDVIRLDTTSLSLEESLAAIEAHFR